MFHPQMAFLCSVLGASASFSFYILLLERDMRPGLGSPGSLSEPPHSCSTHDHWHVLGIDLPRLCMSTLHVSIHATLTTVHEMVSYFVPLAIPEYHRQGGLNKRPWFLTILEAGSPRSRCQQMWGLARAPLLVHRRPFSPCPRMVEGVRELSGGLLYKDTYRFHQGFQLS